MTPGQLSHHVLGGDTAQQHVAVVAVASDDAVFLRQRGLQADRNGFLADVQVAETADQAQAIELAGLSSKRRMSSMSL